MDVGAPELILVLVVCVLLFGAKKLPELARGSGQALRIFKQEMNAKDEPVDPVDPVDPVAPAPRVEPVSRVDEDGPARA